MRKLDLRSAFLRRVAAAIIASYGVQGAIVITIVNERIDIAGEGLTADEMFRALWSAMRRLRHPDTPEDTAA
jgi:hypothetical protein